MSKKVKVEGKVITVPDDATPEEIDQISSGGASAPRSAPQNSTYDPEFVGPAFKTTGLTPKFSKGPGEALGEQLTPDLGTPGRFAGGVLDVAKSVPKALYGAVVEPQIKNIAVQADPKALAGAKLKSAALNFPALPINTLRKLTVDPVVSGYQGAQQAADEGRSLPEIVQRASEGVPIVGPMARGSREAAEQGNNAGAFGQGAANISLLAADAPQGSVFRPLGAPVRGAMKIAGKVVSPLIKPPAPLARESAVYQFRKAINPSAADARDFMTELNDQLDTVVSHGQKTGALDNLAKAKTPGQAQSAVADTLESAAKADPYYNTIVKPHEAKTMSTSTVNGYGGRMVGPNTTTIGDMSARLRTINATLRPKYVAGGGGSAQATAAVTAEQAASLQAEAAQIRSALAKELSKHTGIPADQIAAMRKNYGQLSDLADTVRYHADQTLQAENAAANKPLTPGDFSPANVKGKILGKPLTNPVGKALQNVFQYEAKPPVYPEPSPLPPQVPRAPGWKQAGTEPTQPPVAVPGNAPDAPVTPTGRPMTVRAQRAAAARTQAQQAAGQASVAPPSGAQTEQLAPSVLPPQMGNIPLPNGGGTLARPVPQLPPGPVPSALPAKGSPIPLPASSTEATVSVVHPSGQVGTIPVSDVPEAISRGYKLQNPLGNRIGSPEPFEPTASKVPPVPANHTRAYRGANAAGGAGSDPSFFSLDSGRAASYGPNNVDFVDIPNELLPQFQQAARKAGSGTGKDLVLPPEWQRRAQPHPPLEDPSYDLGDIQ